jgi:hypothetical protein
LHPDERLEQSKNLIDLAGGVEEIKDKMESAFLGGFQLGFVSTYLKPNYKLHNLLNI